MLPHSICSFGARGPAGHHRARPRSCPGRAGPELSTNRLTEVQSGAGVFELILHGIAHRELCANVRTLASSSGARLGGSLAPTLNPTHPPAGSCWLALTRFGKCCRPDCGVHLVVQRLSVARPAMSAGRMALKAPALSSCACSSLRGSRAFAGAAVRLHVRAAGVSHGVARRARALEEMWLRLPAGRCVQAR
jgi:hypothetical protein